jgi:hypothetical protein
MGKVIREVNIVDQPAIWLEDAFALFKDVPEHTRWDVLQDRVGDMIV